MFAYRFRRGGRIYTRASVYIYIYIYICILLWQELPLFFSVCVGGEDVKKLLRFLNENFQIANGNTGLFNGND